MRQEAIALIHQAIVPEGIRASTQDKDNYKRIWARDSVLAGLAGLWSGDRIIADALHNSLKTLALHQSPTGQLPSNVDYVQQRVSYGGLVGRTDATLWWIIGITEYIRYTSEKQLLKIYEPHIQLALNVLRAWEYNDRGLIYSPLGGNWADEYVTQGYTLFDNCLYLWALEGISEVFENEDCAKKAKNLRQLLEDNFYLNTPFEEGIAYYHPYARKNCTKKEPFPVAALAPNGYDTRFDLAANALSLFLTLGKATEHENIVSWLHKQARQQGNWLLPVFYPVIFQDSTDWLLLSNNFSYQFKNEPYHFHNGGCWFIWLGFLAYALKKRGFEKEQQFIQHQIQVSLETEPKPYSFYEYRNTNNFEVGGVAPLCFTAAGAIFSTL